MNTLNYITLVASLTLGLCTTCRNDPSDMSVTTTTPATPTTPTVPEPPTLANKELIDKVQQATFQYFWEFGHPVSGLAPERTATPDVVTSGGSGFGIASIVVGVHRNWITRQEAVQRLLKITGFLTKADRFHGAWSHWLDGRTGKVVPFSQKDNGGDLVETSYLVNGLLIAQAYFDGSGPEETMLRQAIQALWETVEWDWYTKNPAGKLLWHWSPTYNWDMNLPITGYNECLITYVLAASSPTHAIGRDSYQKTWQTGSNYNVTRTHLGYTLKVGYPFGGPLFFSHYSFLGLDPRQLQDEITNYWFQSLNHTLINRAYCIEQAPKANGYSAENWGLTASDEKGGYSAHSPTNDNGTITPTAALSSMPYTPYYAIQAMQYFYRKQPKLWGKYGFYDAFSLRDNWYSDQYLAIDEGPIVVMIENYRSGLPWRLFSRLPDIRRGLSVLGLDQVRYTTGFHLVVPDAKTRQVDLMLHPDRQQYELDFYLEQAESVTVELLTETGTRVTTLIDAKALPPGSNLLTIPATTQPGIYQVTLKTLKQTYSQLLSLH